MSTPNLQRLASRLKLRHYALLRELDRQRSISRTARQLGLAQPTVTRALAEIEDIFMTPLFVRSRRGLEVTPAGELVLARARHALADAATLEQDLASLTAGFRGSLRVGVIPYLSNQTHEALWQHLLGQRPELSYVVEESTSDRLVEAVMDRALDCAICRFSAAGARSGLVQQQLYPQEPRLVVSGAAARRLVRRGTDWEAWASLQWILPPLHTPIREMIHSIFASAGQPLPTPVLEAYAQKTLSAVLRYLPAAITILPDDIALEVAQASGARVLPHCLQWSLPPVSLVRRKDSSVAQRVDCIAAALHRPQAKS